MAKEIERKYLVTSTEYRAMAHRAIDMEQGYLSRRPTVRVRIVTDSSGNGTHKTENGTQNARLTIKGPAAGIVRDEWEYPIPVDDARQIIRLATGIIISKTRYLVDFDGHTWEVDEFHGEHEGLVLAEIELPSPEATYSLPPFVGRDVTDDHSYTNAALSEK